MSLLSLIFIFFVSFVISSFLTPAVRFLAVKFGFVDNPSRHHPAILHQTPIPRAGGVAMFITFFVCSLFFAQIDKTLISLLIASIIMVIVGTLDDKYDLSPILRLAIQIIAGLIIIFSGIKFYTSNPFGNGVLNFDSIRLTIPFINFTFLPIAHGVLLFWIVMLMNISNWTKGASQLPGISVIAFLTLTGVALKYQAGNPYQSQTAILGTILAGAVLAFVPYNFPPEKMFPGFGASTFIGLNLAVLSVLSGGKFATLLIVFIVPIVDAFLVGIKRILSGKSPLANDREHLYHFLLDNHFSKRQIIIIYWLSAIALSLTTLLVEGLYKFYIIFGLAIVITILFILLYWNKIKVVKKPS